MDEYISKKYLEELLDYYLNSSNGAERYGYNIIKGEIGHAPTADVVEVAHGRWILNVVMGYDCSCCGKNNSDFNCKSNYCPNCGAKMNG